MAPPLATLPGDAQPTTDRFQGFSYGLWRECAKPIMLTAWLSLKYYQTFLWKSCRPSFGSATPTSRARPARSPGKFRCDPKGRGVELRSQGIGNRESGIEAATRDSLLPTPTPQQERLAKDQSR